MMLFADNLMRVIIFALWFVGITLAKGAWSTAAAIVFPPWSFYLVVETLMLKTGLV